MKRQPIPFSCLKLGDVIENFLIDTYSFKIFLKTYIFHNFFIKTYNFYITNVKSFKEFFYIALNDEIIIFVCLLQTAALHTCDFMKKL